VTTTNLEPLDLVSRTCTLDSASHSQETSDTLIAEGLDEFGHDHLFVRADEVIQSGVRLGSSPKRGIYFGR